MSIFKIDKKTGRIKCQTIDKKEFLALKASDVVSIRKKIVASIEKDINFYKNGKVKQKELDELNEQGICQSIVDVLENVKEEIEEALWIDQLG